MVAARRMRCMIRGAARLCLLVCPFHSYAAVAARPSTSAAPYRSVQAIRTLPPDQARQGASVDLVGTVLAVSGWKNSFFFQDGHYGISVDRNDAGPSVTAGDTVHIHGVTGEGRFAPVVLADAVHTLRHTGHLPPATPVTTKDMLYGKLDSQWVAVQGIIQAVERQTTFGNSLVVFSLGLPDGESIQARVVSTEYEQALHLLGAAVLVDGVCGSVFNGKRQFIAPQLFLASLGGIHVQHAAPRDLFLSPQVSIVNLGQFRSKTSESSLVQVHGTVTDIVRGKGFYLQEGPKGIFVETSQPAVAAVGTGVQAVGYPRYGFYAPRLGNAVFRPAPMDKDHSAVIDTVDIPDLITTGGGFRYSPYDSLLIRVQGTLIHAVPGAAEYTLLLEKGGDILPVQVPVSALQQLAWLKPGSVLSLVGVCRTVLDDGHQARSVELLLRSPADISVVRPGPWWTADHALWVIAALSMLIFFLGIWLALSRKNASLQQLILTDQLTTLFNRRGFLLHSEQLLMKANGSRRGLLLCFIDLDRFKQINDEFGHESGDAALQEVGKLLRDCFGKGDVIGRLGGDEFAISFLNCPSLTEADVRDRLGRSLEALNRRAGRVFNLSLSLGVLIYRGDSTCSSIEHLLAQADSLMYAEKHQHHALFARQDVPEPLTLPDLPVPAGLPLPAGG